MKRKVHLLVACFLLIALGTVSPAHSVLPSLEAVEPGFKFVVMGDNRAPGPDIFAVTETYKRIISEINQLRPVFAVLTGDTIYGYVGDEDMIRRMWNEWVGATSLLNVPLFKVIGNHDVWGEQAQRLYQEIFNEPLYYSFDYEACHFVVLDSELQGEVGKISGNQLTWLEQDLSNNQGARFTFVFLHRPLWRENTPGWAPVHRLLLEKGADVVFAGHVHSYLADEIDGIRYIISGGAGAPIGRPGDPGGAFFHYCLVSVEPRGVTLAVIKPGSIEPEDIVSAEDLPLANEISTKWTPDPAVRLLTEAEQDGFPLVSSLDGSYTP